MRIDMPDLPDLPEDAEWKSRANCTGVDPDLFFPGRNDTEAIANAKAVCAGCPVSEECLEYAIDRNHHMGVWGGSSENERKAIRRRRRRAVGG